MKTALIAVLLLVVGCTSIEKQESNQRAQIEMIKVQREAREREEKTDAQAKAALYEAISKIAATNPEHSPAALVALTAISMSDTSESTDTPLVALQAQRNEALEWTKALAPTVGNLVSGLGIAAINADVAKTQSDNSRAIQINDANSDVAIVQAVSNLGVVAANQVGIEVGGDYYDVSDQGAIDHSVVNTTTTSTSTSVALSTTLNYDGRGMTLADLIAQLKEAGAGYSITIDGEVVAAEGDPDVEVNCDEPQFSPNLNCS